MRISCDRKAGGGNTRGVGERKIALRCERLRRLDFKLSGLRIAVIGDGAGFEVGGDIVCQVGPAFLVIRCKQTRWQSAIACTGLAALPFGPARGPWSSS